MDHIPGIYQRIQELVSKYLEDTLSDEERVELDTWRNADPRNEADFQEMINPKAIQANLKELDSFSRDEDHALHSILSEPHVKQLPRIGWKRFLAAAVFIGVISIGGLLVYKQEKQSCMKNDAVAQSNVSKPIKPGKSGATLVLPGGKEIPLDSTANGVVLNEQGTEVKKSGNGIRYNSEDHLAALTMHTLKTGKGEQYEVTLSDGSVVKLNALTTFTYPSAFNGATRNVTLTTGEAFFTVAKDITKPFHVNVKGVDIVVTGTQFNINAYSDEAYLKSTLFEGGIKARKDTLDIHLKPGQEFRYDSTTKKWKLVKVDLEEAAAWRNNLFNLEDADVPTVLREISRWYDIDITYSNGFPKGHFEGQIPRSMDFVELVQLLREAGINTKLEGRKLIVL